MSRLILSMGFVILYGSGFVATQFGMPYTEPLTFLSLRFLGTGVILTLLCLAFNRQWPVTLSEWLHTSIAGMLLVGVFSIGVFMSIDVGTSAATSSLIISMQPLLVAMLSIPLLGERLRRSQWLGLAVGVIGIMFILGRQFEPTAIEGALLSLLGLLGLGLGNLYQKKFCANMNIFSGCAIHSLSSGVICIVLAVSFEDFQISWQPEFIGALLWMSIVVSVGALSLLYKLIRIAPVSETASLFYLIPVSATLLSTVVLQSSLDYVEMFGILVTSVAVFMVNRPQASTSLVIKNKVIT